MLISGQFSCQRPYHAERTGSRPITEVKQRRASSVLGWVTAWEHGVLLALNFFLILWCDFGLDRLIFRIMQNLLVMKKSPQINFSPQNVSVINFYRITASKRKLG